ncbi:MAG: CHAT domain-containing protein [Anaerolineae bacterium]|nr:MAG: CHAT domain-containing protein [Anaerolineae bacterium]
MSNFELIDVEWLEEQDRIGWKFARRNIVWELVIPVESLAGLGVSLRSERAYAQFLDRVQKGDFLGKWFQICGVENDKAFLLRGFPRNAYSVPWELLIEGIHDPTNRRNVSIIRSIGNTTLHARKFEKPLIVLVAKGDAANLNIQKEERQILQGYDSLHGSARDRVRPPIFEDVDEHNLGDLLKKHNPDVFWFSGHGAFSVERNEAYVQLHDGNILSMTKLAEIIKGSHLNPSPLYAVFWACDVGSSSELDQFRFASYPDVVEKLSEVGIYAILAMQSPIRDRNAIILARQVFASLAHGLPLERALAYARAELLEKTDQPTTSLDWASPLVWSSGTPVYDLEWGIGNDEILNLQLASLQLLRFEDIELPQEEKELITKISDSWLAANTPRIWIALTSTAHTDYKITWPSLVHALLQRSEMFVLFVDMSHGNRQDPQEALASWAKEFKDRLRGVPQRVSNLTYPLDGLEGRNPLSWNRLLSIDGLFLIVAHPPPQTPEYSWFWDPIRTNHAQVGFCMLADNPLPPSSDWKVDTLDMSLKIADLHTMLEKEPRLMRALSLMQIPIDQDHVRLSDLETSSTQLSTYLDEILPAFVRTDGGLYMRQVVRGFVAEKIPSDQISQAHQDCIQILLGRGTNARTTDKIREEMIYHLINSERIQEPKWLSTTVNETRALIDSYLGANKLHEIVDFFGRVNILDYISPIQFSEDAKLGIAEAYLQIGSLQRAQWWLDWCAPQDELNVCKRYRLQAEVHKSGGHAEAKQKAVETIQEGIDFCESYLSSPQDDPDEFGIDPEFERKLRREYLLFRQDHARMIHFFLRDPAKATAEYASIIAEDDRSRCLALFDRAIVKRNYAECLRKLIPVTEENVREAKYLLDQAGEEATSIYEWALLAEILYEQSKIAQAEGPQGLVTQRLESCISAARRGGHMMLVAIAENRLFWLDNGSVPWNETLDAEWKNIAINLETYNNHGWALRVLVDSRNKAARKLEDYGRPRQTVKLLESNLRLLHQNPSFDSGSDQGRLAIAYAALEENRGFTATPEREFWQEFLSFPWSADWLNLRQFKSSSDVWQSKS